MRKSACKRESVCVGEGQSERVCVNLYMFGVFMRLMDSTGSRGREKHRLQKYLQIYTCLDLSCHFAQLSIRVFAASLSASNEDFVCVCLPARTLSVHADL